MDNFKRFCELLENIKNPKEARNQISDYLKDLTPGEQTNACNFLLGTPLEGTKIGISKKTVEKVLTDRYGLELTGTKSLGDEFLRINESRHIKMFSTLGEIKHRFDSLSKITTEKDRELYIKLIDLPDIQKKYFIDIMLNKLQVRIGFGVIKYSLAIVYGCLTTDVEYAWKRTKSMKKTIRALNGEDIMSQIGEPISPQLAKDVSKEMDRIEYPVQIEGKYDGFRAQVHVHENGKIQIFSRSMQEKTEAFPDVIAILNDEEIKPGIYDGEIYGINNDYSPAPFEKFQHRINVKKATIELMNAYPATIVLFDIIYNANGDHELGQFQRSQALERCTTYWSPWRIVDNREELMHSFHDAIKMGYEGLMIKKMYAKYAPGEGKTNYGNWYKFKPNQTADVLIIGGEMGTGDRRHVLASFNLAVMMDAGILYPVGKCGSGFDMEDLESLTAKAKIMDGIQNANMVIEVRFDKISQNDNSEYAMRFPRFVRFRPDKMIHEIDTLSMIKEYVK